MFSPKKLKSGPGFQSECKACRNQREKDRQKTTEYKARRSDYCKTEKVKKKRRERSSRETNKASRKRYTTSQNGKMKIKVARQAWLELPGNRMMMSMHESMRRMILKGGDYTSSFPGKTQITRKEFIAHIESLFSPGMSWENYGYKEGGYNGGWDVDHRIPKTEYDHSNDEDTRRCWSLSNLTPMWHLENLKKTNKILSSECKKVGEEFWPLSWGGELPDGRVSDE